MHVNGTLDMLIYAREKTGPIGIKRLAAVTILGLDMATRVLCLEDDQLNLMVQQQMTDLAIIVGSPDSEVSARATTMMRNEAVRNNFLSTVPIPCSDDKARVVELGINGIRDNYYKNVIPPSKRLEEVDGAIRVGIFSTSTEPSITTSKVTIPSDTFNLIENLIATSMTDSTGTGLARVLMAVQSAEELHRTHPAFPLETCRTTIGILKLCTSRIFTPSSLMAATPLRSLQWPDQLPQPLDMPCTFTPKTAPVTRSLFSST